MPIAPIWHMPTPWPKPAPRITNASPCRATSNSVDLRPPSSRRICKSPDTSTLALSPRISRTPIRPELPRCLAASCFTRPTSGYSAATRSLSSAAGTVSVHRNFDLPSLVLLHQASPPPSRNPPMLSSVIRDIPPAGVSLATRMDGAGLPPPTPRIRLAAPDRLVVLTVPAARRAVANVDQPAPVAQQHHAARRVDRSGRARVLLAGAGIDLALLGRAQQERIGQVAAADLL